MKIEKSVESYDVLVVGAGIAGIMSAIRAAKQGMKVCLVSSSNICSGSSFHPGTWGLGVVTPENEADASDLMRSIVRVGCGMADEEMVLSFVTAMAPALEELRELGLPLLEAKEKNQRDFIPCFDHKIRNWHGLVGKDAAKSLKQIMQQLKIEQKPYCELVELIEQGATVQGAVFYEHETSKLIAVCASAVILATGGMEGLYENHLTTSDICATGQYLAWKHGCELINLEFHQMMPGYLGTLRGTIFNERTFRYAALTDASGRELLDTDVQELLTERGTYGPFTSRLRSKEVDFAIEQAGADGANVCYSNDLTEDMPEFIKTYFDWLKTEKGVEPDAKLQIAMFAHASNGGIKISPKAETNVAGLFACGEATGGMHGADRIGGLSTVNGIVFGIKAGDAAACFVKEQVAKSTKDQMDALEKELSKIEQELWQVPNAAEYLRECQQLMTKSAFIKRNEDGLNDALLRMRQLVLQMENEKEPMKSISKAVETKRIYGQLMTAQMILMAELLRKESRGSHYRADYPKMDMVYERKILVRKTKGQIRAEFEDLIEGV